MLIVRRALFFIVYAIMTEQSVGKLFIAGVLPGLFYRGSVLPNDLYSLPAPPDIGPGRPSDVVESQVSRAGRR